MPKTVSPAIVSDPEAPAEVIDPQDAEPARARIGMLAAVAEQPDIPFRAGLEAQLQLLEYMRSRRSFLIDVRPARAINLVWRLVAITGLAVAVATTGVLLTAVAFVGGSLEPNPFVAISVLLVGVVLVTTVLKVVSGDRGHA